ncbi:hypothetical protein CMK14_00410 [Candidatus Poribacteria bacterium]|nr:hypothetical protein [Candidatus Poribacteria bacterium]
MVRSLAPARPPSFFTPDREPGFCWLISTRRTWAKNLSHHRKGGGTASIFMADVTQSDQCQAMADEVVSRYGSIDILSNNVGIGSAGTVLDAEESEWDRVLDVNLKSMFLTSKFVIPRMIETCTLGGLIINIASIDGMRANWWPNISYAVSKAGAIAA